MPSISVYVLHEIVETTIWSMTNGKQVISIFADVEYSPVNPLTWQLAR